MINYDTINNVVGTFPNAVSQNATGPGATDGTPYIKDVIDDLWGHNQDLMNLATLSPDASAEANGASQRTEAIRRVGGYPGVGVPWFGNTDDPATTFGVRLLELKGQGILRANYVELDLKTYVGDGDNPTASAFYRADDAGGAVRNTTGVYLILPDSRGQFIRGFDSAGTIDPDGASRDIGNIQDWAIQKNNHYVWSLANYMNELSSKDFSAGARFVYEGVAGAETVSDLFADSILVSGGNQQVAAANQDSDESRSTNIAARWAIYY